jgi:hypothetical protein
VGQERVGEVGLVDDVAAQQRLGQRDHHLRVVGVGPGAEAHMSERARALTRAETAEAVGDCSGTRAAGVAEPVRLWSELSEMPVR